MDQTPTVVRRAMDQTRTVCMRADDLRIYGSSLLFGSSVSRPAGLLRMSGQGASKPNMIRDHRCRPETFVDPKSELTAEILG